MRSTPIILSLVGLALFLFGIYMMLRIITLPLSEMGMSDNPGAVNIDVLRQDAGSWVLGTYIAMTASGFAIFSAGLTMLWGRRGSE